MLCHQRVQPLGIFPHSRQVSFLDGAPDFLNLPAKISQGGVAQGRRTDSVSVFPHGE